MSRQIVPPAFLFQYLIPVPFRADLPRRRGRILALDAAARLFVPATLNDAAVPMDLRVAWNNGGIGVQLELSGKKLPPAGRRRDLKTSDHITLSFDTRHTANVHRATEFCTSLIVLPADEDAEGAPTLQFSEIAQQRTVRQDRSREKCPLNYTAGSQGYTVELWIPASELPGFQEAPDIGKIGFYCVVHDTELGELPLSVGGDFPVAWDPSTWLSLELKANA